MVSQLDWPNTEECGFLVAIAPTQVNNIRGQSSRPKETNVKVLLSLFLSINLCAGIPEGQNQSQSVQPTPLEAFAHMPATQLAWSKEVGRIVSGEAQAIIVALVLEDTAQPPDRMRGVRIELSSNHSKDQLFLDEETLSIYKHALNEINAEATRQRNEGTARDNLTADRTAYVGAGTFWYADKVPRVHSLNAAHYFAQDSTGLYLSAFKGIGFRFPDQQASQLSAAIARAMNELKNR